MRVFCLLCEGVLVLAVGCTSRNSGKVDEPRKETADLKIPCSSPPASLDNLFPPKTEAPVFLLKMLGLGSSLSAIAADVSEGDLGNARAGFERFKSQYDEASQLVPEWRRAFAGEPVIGLGAALEGGDPNKVMAAFGELDKVCHNCHMDNMPAVQQKYHWRDFSDIGVTDPATGRDVDFKQLMLGLSSSFEGIRADLQQGQAQAALKHYGVAKARFQTLGQTCQACHETERTYYVGKGVQTLLDRLGKVLSSSVPDQKQVGELSQGIAMESCSKCHLVHMPAALARARWARDKKPTGRQD